MTNEITQKIISFPFVTYDLGDTISNLTKFMHFILKCLSCFWLTTSDPKVDIASQNYCMVFIWQENHNR